MASHAGRSNSWGKCRASFLRRIQVRRRKPSVRIHHIGRIQVNSRIVGRIQPVLAVRRRKDLPEHHAIAAAHHTHALAATSQAISDARFAANFARLGFHQGFGLSVTLPALVGQQKALELLYTGRRINGEEALAIGMADRLVPQDALREEAHAFALEIARSAPLAVLSIRQTMRGDLADKVKAATDHELVEQDRLRRTEDFKEGVRATAERRLPDFKGR